MQVYKYDEITGEFVGVETAQLDPLETKLQGKEIYLLPANATFTAPLVVKDGYAQVYKDGVWNYVEDNRGKEYWLADDEYGTPAREMKELGAFPVNAVFTAPEKPAPTAEEIQKALTDGVQAYMDTTAQTRRYDNIHTACSYANSTDEVFKAEGQACLAWRDAVWRKCYNILDEVTAGTRPIPTLEEVIAELPVLVW